ncbi:MAG: hypothetical protein H7A45_06325 [Verrucomicrobiales bacterium]|nr:hypothetical protein [Verrucomicrobiales bacterium]
MAAKEEEPPPHEPPWGEVSEAGANQGRFISNPLWESQRGECRSAVASNVVPAPVTR